MSAYGSGLSNPSPPIYIDDTKINLVSTVSNLENRNFPSWVRWSAINNLNIPKDFLLKAWFYPSRVSTKLLKLYSTLAQDYVDIYYERGATEDFIVVKTYSGTLINKSFGKTVNINDKCFIWLKHDNSVWDLKIDILEDNPQTVISWNGVSNAQYNTTTEIKYENEIYGAYVQQTDIKTNVLNSFNSLIISNSIFDHLTISDDLTEVYSDISTDINNIHTLFNCNFNNNVICLMLNAPTLIAPTSSINATEENVIYFDTDEREVVKNRLQIFEYDTDQEVYNSVQISYNFEHVIPSGTLVNGKRYYARLKTYTKDDKESYWSNSINFYCYSIPTVEYNIQNGDIIHDSNVSFQIIFNQAEGEKVDYITIELYNKYNIKIAYSDKLTNYDYPPVVFVWNASVFSEGEYYTVIKIKTESGTIINHTINFIVDIDEEKEQYLDAEVDSCNGYVKVTAYPNVMGVGESKPSPPTYIKHEKVELISCVSDLDDIINCNWVKWSNVGIDIPTNFVLRAWFSPSRISNKLMKLYSVNESDYIEIYFERGATEDYISVRTNSGTIIDVSFGETVTINDSCFLWVKYNNGLWDVRCEKLNMGLPQLISWNNGSNVIYNTSTDIKYGVENYGNYNVNNIQKNLENSMDSLIIANGIFDHININKNVNIPYSTDIPQQSTSNTVINCSFQDNLSCSDISADKVIIYHKETNETEWVKLLEKNLNAGYNDISFNDIIIKNNVEIEYMAEYYSNNIIVDTKYKTVTPYFDRVFISDSERTFKFEANVIYSNNAQNVQVGTLIPLGSKYPILVQNAKTNYKSGNIRLTVMGKDFEKMHIISRESMRSQAEEILDFLTNKKVKIIKDWNGNIFVFRVSSSPTIEYDSSYGNGIINIGFDWVEQSDYHDFDALREFGFYS